MYMQFRSRHNTQRATRYAVFAAAFSLAGLAQTYAQSSTHRADFGSFAGERGVASIVVGDAGEVSYFYEAENVVEGPLSSASLLVGGASYALDLTSSKTFEGVLDLSLDESDPIRQGLAELQIEFEDTTQIRPVTDIGFDEYGAGSHPGGGSDELIPRMLGLGHVVMNGPIALVAKDLPPGSIGGFFFSGEQGAGEWSAGCQRHIGPIATSEWAAISEEGAAEWGTALPPSVSVGDTLYAQFVGQTQGGSLFASNGIKLVVRPGSTLSFTTAGGVIEARFSSGRLVAQAELGANQFADPGTQTFLGAGTGEGESPSPNSALISHPALRAAAGPLYGLAASGQTQPETAEEEQRVLIGAMVDLAVAHDPRWETDGCSVIPFETSFEDCCDLHDVRYCIGGTEADRKAADLELAGCVAMRTGSFDTAELVYNAVQAFGAGQFNFH